MKKILFTLFVGIVTVFSIYSMLEIKKLNMAANSEILQYVNPIAEDDSYNGYIFDDYNINVNLNFRDKIEKSVDSNNIDPSSITQDDSKNNADVMSMTRSERAIDEKELKDEPSEIE